MKLTFYLFKPTVNDFSQAVKSTKLTGQAPFEEVSLKNVRFEGKAYFQRDKDKSPPWLAYVQDYCDILAPDKILNTTNSFLLLLKISGRIFAITTGFGFTAINREELEPDFGLRVTLNSVDKEKLRSVQSRNVDTTTLHKHLVVSRNSGVNVFDVDFYRELLARMEGIPKDPELGKRVQGADSCTLDSSVQFPELDKKCRKLLLASRRATYRDSFPFVDLVRPVRKDDLLDDLNARLTDAIKQGKTERLGLALPDISSTGAIEQFRVHQPGCEAALVDELEVEDVMAYLKVQNCNDVDVEGFTVVGIDSAGNAVTSELPLYRCAVFETKIKKLVYVLTLGKWYEVDSDYVSRVETNIAARAQQNVIANPNYLPEIGKKQSEGAYNMAAAKVGGLVCMDKNCASIAGASRVEVCDLFSPNGDFIHVKRKTRSATLSHLFSQGSVSAELFFDHRPYREFVRDQLPANLKRLVNPSTPNPSKFKVVYAISANKSAKLPEDLPFFSKVTLLYHQNIVERMGFRSGLFHIKIKGRP